MLKQILKQLNIKSQYNELYDAIENKLNCSVFGSQIADKILF